VVTARNRPSKVLNLFAGSPRANGQGLCPGHNHVKEMPGWHHRVVAARPGHHTVEVTTPTGHQLCLADDPADGVTPG